MKEEKEERELTNFEATLVAVFVIPPLAMMYLMVVYVLVKGMILMFTGGL